MVRGLGRGVLVVLPLLLLFSPAESLASGRELLREVRGMGLGGEWLPLAECPPDEDTSSLLPVECSCSVGDSLSSACA